MRSPNNFSGVSTFRRLSDCPGIAVTPVHVDLTIAIPRRVPIKLKFSWQHKSYIQENSMATYEIGAHSSSSFNYGSCSHFQFLTIQYIFCVRNTRNWISIRRKLSVGPIAAVDLLSFRGKGLFRATVRSKIDPSALKFNTNAS